jgi:membrane protein
VGWVRIADPLDTIENIVWSDRLEKAGPLGKTATTVMRYLYGLLRDVFAGDLNMCAMSLVYTTLLSVVPLLAFSFAILKGLGVFDRLEPYLVTALEPLGEQGVEITATILGLVNNVQGSLLGGVSMVILLWTVISTIQRVESSFNYVWYVTTRRSFARRSTEYIVVLVVGPVFMVAAITLIGSMGSSAVVQYLSSLPGAGELLAIAGKLVPYFIVSGVFTFLYMFMPNTRVRLSSALVGGFGGGAMWVTMATIFTTFVVTAARTQNMYANFAVAIFALIWLYLNWLVLLVGSQLAFYHQNPAFLRIGRQEPRLSNSMRERVALNIMMFVGGAFRSSEKDVSIREISARLNIPTIALSPISSALEEGGMLVSTEHELLMPGREMSRIRLSDILSAVRVEGETGSYSDPIWSAPIGALGRELDDAMVDVVGEKTLADLLDEVDQTE